ncbi:MAG TPA: class I SAM-dependent methyltransferase [Rhizomicrobium sp.]|nr:class I SAM-dependent methyltransferase [Rhizomicrobium sp.]
MTFSREWDTAYKGKQRAIWPWSDMVSYVNRYARPADGFRRVLEMGCGAGANIPFFVQQGMDYYSIEGSPTIVARLHEAFPELRARILVGDFTAQIPFDGPFDLVVDRASIAHNNVQSIARTLELVFSLLRPGGKFIGIDWFSRAHSAARSGVAVDSHTRTDIPTAQFAGIGAVYFADQDHIIALLGAAGFVVERLEHKQHRVVIPTQADSPAWWNFVAAKP